MVVAHGLDEHLVGRDAQLVDIDRALRSGARTVVLQGIAGAGKTALLDTVRQRSESEGWQVVALQGRRSEERIAFAGLVDLLQSPGLRGTDHVAQAADRLVRRLLAREDAEHPGAAALSLRLEVLAWLQSAAGPAPVLVLVDDVQWVDASSWSVLAFVAHRLADGRVSLAAAVRAGAAVAGISDHHVVPVPPLGLEDALELLRRRGAPLDPVERMQVVRRAAGNPLALLELSQHARSGMPASVQAAFADELPLLPPSTRDLLLLAAAGGDSLAVLARASASADLVEDLEPAERAGLVRVHDGQLVFRHPLVRSAVYEAATTAERLVAHERLAEAHADHPERHVWHRAAATVAPDEDVALALAEAAALSRRRGAHSEAAEAMLRAAELTPLRTDRERRMLDALSYRLPTGQVAAVAAMAERIRRESSDPAIKALAGQSLAYALAQSMRQVDAQATLERALDELLSIDPDAGWSSLTTLASLTYQTCRNVEIAALWLERYDEKAEVPPAPYDRLMRAARAWVRVAISPLSRPRDLIELVRDTPPADGVLTDDLVAPEEMLLGAAAWLLNEHDVALRRLGKAAGLMRRGFGSSMLVQTEMALGQAHFDVGAYDAAEASARAMIDIADAEALAYYRAVGRELLARVRAVRGDTAWARRSAEELLESLDVGECVSLETNLRVTLAYVHFSDHDDVGCYEQLRSLFDRDGDPIHPHVSYRALGDLASAAVRTGQVEAVRPVLARAEQRLSDTPSSRQTMILCRAKALLDESSTEALFERATRDPGAARWPLEWANAHLEHGIWLRRQHRTPEARQRLRHAHEVFRRIGADAWAATAAAELRAAGVGTSGPTSSGWSSLTAQERQVVELAATGLTNKEIAGTLFLSPRTVSAHLYHAFPKLGVTSRSQLRDVVAGWGPKK